MVSRAFSRKSSRQGLMTISSGSVCRATQAYSLAVFTPPLPLALAAKQTRGSPLNDPDCTLLKVQSANFSLFSLSSFFHFFFAFLSSIIGVFPSAALINMHEPARSKISLWILCSFFFQKKKGGAGGSWGVVACTVGIKGIFPRAEAT